MNKLALSPEDTVVSVDIKWVDDWWAITRDMVSHDTVCCAKIAFFRVVTVKYSNDLEDGDSGIYTYCTPMRIDAVGDIEDATECTEDKYVQIAQGKGAAAIEKAWKIANTTKSENDSMTT